MTHTTPKLTTPIRARWAIVPILLGAVLLAACSGPNEPPPADDTPTAAPSAAAATHDHAGDTGNQPIANYADEPLVVNVEVTETGFSPAVLFLPQGRTVQLVFRNRSTEEAHYHIVGLEIDGLRWVSNLTEGELDHSGTPAEGAPVAAAAEGHEHHGGGELVDFHVCTSAFGICPTGEWVHAHAAPGDMDSIFFTPLSPGRFSVENPLVPTMTAVVVVS